MNVNGVVFQKGASSFSANEKNKVFSGELLVWMNYFPSVKTNFRPNYYTFRLKDLFGQKPGNLHKWPSITFLSLLPISHRLYHMKYL